MERIPISMPPISRWRYPRPESFPVRHLSTFHLASRLCMSNSEQDEQGCTQDTSLHGLLVQNYRKHVQHDSGRLWLRRISCEISSTDCAKLAMGRTGSSR